MRQGRRALIREKKMERMDEQNTRLIHISHLHPLYLTHIQPQREQLLAHLCHACHLPCTGQAYQCSQCRYFLHPSCARLPQTLRHSAHPDHPLNLHLTPVYVNGTFACNACKQACSGFSFHCSLCQFDLHLPCAALPETLDHPSHPHLMILRNNSMDYICDLCRGECEVSRWIYICTTCDYGGHVGCFASRTRIPKELYELHERADQERNQQEAMYSVHLQQQARMAARNISRMGSINAVMLTSEPNQYVWRH
ncbi:protein VACUOLELESS GAMETOPHYTES-like [Typha angustifolia]|uniref:protein VACUOLELESS GAMETOPHYTES-like n=1 Tax=Typha angustifolia TaxID=59011 RepID=UPI003C2FE869